VLRAACLVAAVGAVVALVVVALGGGDEPRLAPPSGEAVVLRATVDPVRYAFGDRLTAEIELVVDRTRADPDSVVPAAFFRPFRRVGPIAVERVELGDTTVLRYRYRIQCVDRACVPRGAEKAIELPLGLVRYTPVDGDIVTLPLQWPTVEVASRLPAGVQADIRARPAAVLADGSLDELPQLDPTGGPLLLGWLLVGAACALVLAVAGWFAWTLRSGRERADGAVRDLGGMPPLESALGRVERALASGEEPERRRALDELACRLVESDRAELGYEARRLAWSQDGPVPDRAAALVRAAREAA
jgi:hypothetical protein